MKDIYLLIEHGMDQGEVYVLGWFDDEKRAREVAEEKEWEVYRAKHINFALIHTMLDQ